MEKQETIGGGEPDVVPATEKMPISEADMYDAYHFTIDMLQYGTIDYTVAYAEALRVGVNRFAFVDVLHALRKQGIIIATGKFGYGDLSLASSQQS